MNTFDKMITIQASPDLVWQESRRFAKKGRIISEENQQLLVSIGTLKIGYVYFINEQPDGSTQLRHVIGMKSAIEEALASSRPLPDALNGITLHTDTVSEVIAGFFLTFLQFPTFEETGEGQLKKIKSRAERAAVKPN
jgi:hypothetical protein